MPLTEPKHPSDPPAAQYDATKTHNETVMTLKFLGVIPYHIFNC